MLRIKRVHTPQLRGEVFALRYRAYRSVNALSISDSERFEDEYDYQDNHVLWALTDNDTVVGSIRVTWHQPSCPGLRIPEQHAYADELQRVVPSGKRVLSGNRFVTDPGRSHWDKLYAMLLLRHYMVVAHLKADIAVAAVRVNHLMFYRRVLKLERASGARLYPGLQSKMYLTACDFARNIDSVYGETPVLKPRGCEHIFMNERHRELWEVGLSLEQ